MLNLVLAAQTNNTLFPFWTYALAYTTLVALISLLIWSTIESKNWNNLLLLPVTFKTLHFKYALIVLILCMAGLPPFHFFILKVGLLTYLANSTPFSCFCIILIFLLISWYAYQAVAIKALPVTHYTTRNNVNTFTMWSIGFFFGFILFLLFGFFFIEELFFVGSWLTIL